jgi:ubiquinone/menaquinone biosynthesis C-methylase UbiE
MRFYARHILPRVIEFGMTRAEVTALRAANVPAARGTVLEVGIGSGLNLPFYTGDVTRLYGIDASLEMLSLARTRTNRVPFPVVLIQQRAESIPLANAAIDTAVMTWALCSIGDPLAALREIRRVLRPSGMLIFVEHGLSPHAGVRKWQNRATPVWRHVAGGCHLNRKIDDLVRESGFEIGQLEMNYVPGPRPLTFMYAGRARLDH